VCKKSGLSTSGSTVALTLLAFGSSLPLRATRGFDIAAHSKKGRGPGENCSIFKEIITYQYSVDMPTTADGGASLRCTS